MQGEVEHELTVAIRRKINLEVCIVLQTIAIIGLSELYHIAKYQGRSFDGLHRGLGSSEGDFFGSLLVAGLDISLVHLLVAGLVLTKEIRLVLKKE